MNFKNFISDKYTDLPSIFHFFSVDCHVQWESVLELHIAFSYLVSFIIWSNSSVFFVLCDTFLKGSSSFLIACFSFCFCLIFLIG